jgi:hypothetical protein
MQQTPLHGFHIYDRAAVVMGTRLQLAVFGDSARTELRPSLMSTDVEGASARGHSGAWPSNITATRSATSRINPP